MRRIGMTIATVQETPEKPKEKNADKAKEQTPKSERKKDKSEVM